MPKSKSKSKVARFIPWWLILIYVIAAGAVCLDIYLMRRAVSPNNNLSQNSWPSSTVAPSPTFTPTPASSETTTLPSSVLLDVPFIPQAPNRIWDSFHKETCEEASLLSLMRYIKDQPAGTKDQIDLDLKAIWAYETEHGYLVDVTVEELAEIAKAYAQVSQAEVKYNPTLEELKQYLANGQPIIIPAAGRLLNNPNFTAPGPPYHMLVLKGYNSSDFITNDPGTWQGESYTYPQATIMNAIHNWNPTDINQGTKAVLLLK